MSVRIGLYDFMAYTLPGGIYLLTFLYIAKKYFLYPIDFTNVSTTTFIIFTGLSFVVGLLFDSVLTRTWYRLFRPKDLLQSIIANFNKRNSRIHVQHPDMDWYIHLSFIRRHNLEMAHEIERFNVYYVMLRNVSFSLLIIAIVSLIEFVRSGYQWRCLFLTLLCTAFSVNAAKRAVTFNAWFYNAIYQSVAALTLEPSQLSMKVIETNAQEAIMEPQNTERDLNHITQELR